MYGFIEKDSDLKIEDAVYDEVLNAGLGWMHELKKVRHSEYLILRVTKPLIRHFMIWKSRGSLRCGTDNRGTEKYLFDNGKYFKSRVGQAVT